ncbi:MAG: uroporphyrinogen-III synthase [Acidobacteriota bacterium]
MDSGLGTSLPLADRRVIVTRAFHQAHGLITELQRLGATVTHIPTIEILPPQNWSILDHRLSLLTEYEWLVFSSTNGVEYFLKRFDELRGDRRALDRVKVAAVGPATAQMLEKQGINVELESSASTAADLANALIERYASPEDLEGLRVLFPTSNIGRDAIPAALGRHGAIVDVVTVYRTEAPAISREELFARLGAARADDIVFASPSAVTNLASILGTDGFSVALKGVRVVCIGQVTADAANQHGLRVDMQPKQATVDSIIEALIDRQTDS